MTDEPTTDSSGGIRVPDGGGFRIRNFRLTIADDGELVDSSFVAELRTDVFPHWLHIAEGFSVDAQRAREDAVSLRDKEGEAFNKALEAEFRASMLAITAAAF